MPRSRPRSSASSSRSVTCAVLGCGLAAVLTLAGCDRQSGPAAQPSNAAAQTAPSAPPAEVAKGIDRSHRGSALPALSFADPAGRKLALGSLRGKPLLINLWATWCAPCIKELPTLDALAAQGTVRVLTVSQDAGDPARVGQFLTGKRLGHLEPWLDPNNDLAFHYGAGTLPTTVYYDAAGREVWRFVGEHDWGSPETARLLAEAR